MALIIPCEGHDTIDTEDYLDYVQAKVDLNDEDSIAESAPMLRALANDRELIVRRLNELIARQFSDETTPSSQAILLGQRKNFYVRANVWPSTADIVAGRVFQGQFSYDLAHDHNFSFLTVNYSGSGYETDLFEYDFESVVGYVGESVSIRPLQRMRFGRDMAMLYRASRDLHVQHPPKEMSITLNLMVSVPEVRAREQYFFDLERGVIAGYPAESENSKRSSFFRIASMLGDGNTRDLLADLMVRHPSPRARIGAVSALDRLAPDLHVWALAVDDPHPLVTREARAQLAQQSDRDS